MTEAEVIKNINALNAVCGQKDFYNEEFVEALKMGVDALKKQIEKKPIYKEGGCYSRAKDGSEIREIIPECPNCHSIALKHSFPCRCGQRLKWGVIDDSN